ncbi:FliM/FliN family flagellar motor switch protein [Janthinobacterium sp. GW460P]|uniref:FliM/FliN family flagellar motor C-terminal domain-containing protein n=1 Tax=unclassified Janthinobacterium TaxID=2610881 RepID=UPI000A31E73F|nr:MULTISPECIES: FliM/FliN family flagellar motor C-terminal domain-containing protein [unclassified Janthinobacterium]MCC7705601.1 FliM/FliN family flagellar motor switch protein [Janthinobacterium sp. GW460P]MCC7711103.1 FliM/FliN family flagellar motor switch protein [Janthinobacterium sp. GW460W]
MSVQPYLLISDTVLAAVTGHLRAAFDAWCAQWGIAASEMELDCLRAWEAPAVSTEASWRALRSSGDDLWWYACTPDWNLQLRQAMFPQGIAEPVQAAQSGMADEVAEAATQALFASLSGTTQDGTPLAPPAAAWSRGAGVVALRLGLGKQSMHVIVSQTAVLRIAQWAGHAAGRLPPLASVNYLRALRDIRLSLPLEVGRAEVGLGSLMLLGVGDVIRLDTLADRPLTVMGPGGGALFDAYLGLADKKVALEVVRRD